MGENEWVKRLDLDVPMIYLQPDYEQVDHIRRSVELKVVVK